MSRIYILTLIVIAVLSMAILTPTNAYFLDSVSSGENTFAVASSFPSSITPSTTLTDTPTETPTITPSETPTTTPSATPTPGPGDVVINEIMWMGSSINDADEWIELRNTSSNLIDISNWVLENADSPHITFATGSTIPAGGFYLITNNSRVTSHIDVDSDLVTASVSLLNDGEQLVLKHSNGTTIDTANGTSTWFFGENSPVKRSMARKTPALDGANAGNWQNATTQVNLDAGSPDFGSPKAANGF